ncbi:hypothetical protein ACE38W_11955 [Chitinophaga sp. Hz27]|uniref:hypothetical protein n=1 Tax=Chitinophaga sp. Hz27 TaxID=3347169 RepID=UPI0035D5C209
MTQHNGMRPQDIAVLLKIIISPGKWMQKDIAAALFLSAAEVNNSLQRSKLAELIDKTGRKVMRRTLLEFIQYGLPHVFPAIRGSAAKGLPTAYSAPIMSKFFIRDQSDNLVWADPKGTVKGESISPLYPNIIKAALHDPELYELLILVDVMRVGKVREKEVAMKLLKEKFDQHHA